jgi:hypothetical protein
MKLIRIIWKAWMKACRCPACGTFYSKQSTCESCREFIKHANEISF